MQCSLPMFGSLCNAKRGLQPGLPEMQFYCASSQCRLTRACVLQLVGRSPPVSRSQRAGQRHWMLMLFSFTCVWCDLICRSRRADGHLCAVDGFAWTRKLTININLIANDLQLSCAYFTCFFISYFLYPQFFLILRFQHSWAIQELFWQEVMSKFTLVKMRWVYQKKEKQTNKIFLMQAYLTHVNKHD